MRWLIDGYNLIRRDPELAQQEARGLEDGRAALLRVIAAAARASGDPFTVVFDGARRTGGAPAGGQVQVVFSRPPETADDVLRRLALELRSGAVVVTSDRAVRDTAERAGAAAVTAEQFLAALESDADGDADEAARPPRGGNPRRPSRAERAARRVLGRLRAR
ncbi:MAG TPA: NYN domain-containing protein [Methylomirabilota bacterium]|jgi:predicted RNA-binding protein with PIN domain